MITQAYAQVRRISFLIISLFSAHFLLSQTYIPNVEHFNIDNGLSHNQLNWIYKDQRGIMWFGAFDGINRYDGQDIKFITEVNFAFANNEDMFEDETGDLWIERTINGTEPGLLFFNTITEKVKTFDEKFGSNPPFQLSNYQSRKRLKDHSIKIYLKSGQEIILPSIKGLPTSINPEENKDLSLKITHGKFHIYHTNQPDTPIITYAGEEVTISSSTCLLRDGNFFWIGSINGVYKLQLKLNPFKKSLYSDPAVFYSCRGIAEDNDGNIYVTQHGPIYNIKSEVSIGNEKYGRSISDILYDKEERWWFYGDEKIQRVDFKTGAHQEFDFSYKKFRQGWRFYQDKDGRIWCGGGSGLAYYEEGFSDFLKFENINGHEGIHEIDVYDFFEDKEGILWIATTSGIFQLDFDKGLTERFWKKGDSSHSLPAFDFRHIHQDDAGIFWMATREGLIRWDKEKSTARLFSKLDGFSNNVLNAVYEDDFGFLWISSENGIIQFEKSTSKVKNYFSSDGITHPEFNRISHYKDKEGNIYFGSMNGVTYFHPRDFVEVFNQPNDIPIVLTECHIFSEKSKQQENRITDFYRNKQLTISPSDRYLTLQFALLDYSKSNELEYIYEIDGEQWKVSKDNSINISSLPYGNHNLTVKGRMANGLFSKHTLSIPILVLRPFYLQWWFLGLCIVALASLIFIYQKRKTQKFIKQKEELEKTVQERTQTIQTQAEKLLQLNKAKSKFMANISHEFRTPLTLILNTLNLKDRNIKLNDNDQGKTFTYKEMDVEIMDRNAHRLQQLIDQLLDLSKMEAGKMTLRASQNDFSSYLKNLVSSFQPLAKNKNITLTFISSLEKCNLYFDRDKMDKIVYNLLGNALKFTPSNKDVKIMLERQNNEVVFEIIDSGIGIPAEELPLIFDRFYRGDLKDEFAYEGTGLGLALVKDFVEIHYGKIEVKSTKGLGTKFTIHLPMGDAHLQPEEKIIFKEASTLAKQQKVKSIILEASSELISAEKPILLIIEDNEDLLYHHQQNFQNDFQLLLAKDGEEGINLATEHLPNLIVCDVMMPKKNGYEVCQHLKLDERTSHIPIILLTAKADHSEKMEGLMVGADEYLTKPYNQKELEVRLENLLVRQQHLQGKYKKQIKETHSLSTSTSTSTIKTPQERFVEKCTNIVIENYKNPNFSVEEWSNQVFMSRAQFFRKTKIVLGVTPTQFIRTYRLEKAKELLSEGKWNGSEVAYMVGFKNPNYFFKCFKDEYGMTVGDFVKS